MRRTRTALLGVLTVGVGLAGAAAIQAAGGPDDTYGAGGVALTPLSPSSDRYLGATRAPGGGTYNVGYTTVAGMDRAFVVTRVDEDGELVPGFGVGGVAVVNVVTGPFDPPPTGTAPNGSAEIARGVVVQADGKIVISGQAETPPGLGALDSRDQDIYVVRLLPNGSPDPTFGGPTGTVRINLSNGVPTTGTPNTDQAYGLDIRPNGKILVIGARGVDSGTPAKTDRDLIVAQLNPDGSLDATFGTGGVATSPTPGLNENPRRGLLESNGNYVATAYGTGIGGQTRPFITRFLPGGTPDPSFGVGGVATGEVGGPAPGFAEAYGAVRSGDGYVLAGYGSRSTTPANGIDVVVYRFTDAGVYDTTFADGGLLTYNRVNGADRGRDIAALPDGRIVVVGSSATPAPGADLDALVLVANPNGTLDSSFGNSGVSVVDLGGPNDAFFGITPVLNGSAVVAAGYRGGAMTDADEAGLLRVLLPTPPAATPPPPPPPPPPTPPAPSVVVTVPGPPPPPVVVTVPVPTPVTPPTSTSTTPAPRTATVAPRPTFTLVRRGTALFLRVRASPGSSLAGRAFVVQRRVGRSTLGLRSLRVPADGRIDVQIVLRPRSRSGAAGILGATRISVRATIAARGSATAASSPFRSVVVR